MSQSDKELLQQVELLLKGKKYQDINLLLTDNVLEQYNSAVLYAYKSRVLSGLGKTEDGALYAQKAINIDPMLPMAFFARGFSYYGHDDEKAFEDYDKAIQLNENYIPAYVGRGNTWYNKKNYDKALDDYTKAIQLDPNYTSAHRNIGLVWSIKKDNDRAIEAFTKAIESDENYIDVYNDRGIIWHDKKIYKKAIDDYNKAIQLDENYPFAYYNRGRTYSTLGEYKKAIDDYQNYIKLINNPDDYNTKIALSEIERLRANIRNEWYKEIEQIISEIRQLLVFDERCITHYTSLSAAKAMILESSPFRLSEGAYLNDTSEGKELFKYLSFETPKSTKDGTIEENFIEKPFIGSFVADNKHNNLTLWRMYGKEAQIEAKGCALTIEREQFINSFKAILNPVDKKESIISESGDKFTFYKVAYWDNEEFLIPGDINKDDLQKFNQLLKSLKDKIAELNSEQKYNITQLLNDIAYLFKSAEYQYEYEVRLVVQGVGIAKVIDKSNASDEKTSPPRVYIKMIEIAPVLEKITLGPKVERADEWAAAFNYHIQETYKKKVEIVISHLPFK